MSTFANHFNQMKHVVGEERRLAVIHFVENTSQSPRQIDVLYSTIEGDVLP